MWRVLVSGKDQHPGGHPARPGAIGPLDPNWTGELMRMEAAGLVVPAPDPQETRVSGVELTEAGEALFHGLLRAVVAFDRRLRVGLDDQEISAVSGTLARLRINAADGEHSKITPIPKET